MLFIKDAKTSWEYLKETNLPIVMYGTGNGADKIIDELQNLNIKLSGVFASDDFSKNKIFRGYKVQKLADFEKNFNDFIVIIGFGTSRPEVMERIDSISKIHETLVPCVPVYGDKIFNRDFINKYEQQLNAAYGLLADTFSKQVFEGAVNFQLTGKLDSLRSITTSRDEAFNNILKLSEDEFYLDAGAYRGDTVQEFLRYCKGKYSFITAAEPNIKTFKKLELNTKDLEKCSVLNCAVWDNDNEKICCENDRGRGSFSESGSEGNISCISIDTIGKKQSITYIKMDIEGTEEKALKGGTEVLKKYKPKLNIAGYHKSEDIFEIPLLIHSINPEYKIYLRKHPYIPCWDLNFYCT